MYALVSFSSLPSLVLSLGANYLNGFHLCDQTTLTDWFPQRWSSPINLCLSIKGACLQRSFSSALTWLEPAAVLQSVVKISVHGLW